MSKTLLLIICDFLLISVLALVEFNPNNETDPPIESEVRNGMEGDLIEVLQLSLEQEASEKASLNENLEKTQTILEETSTVLENTNKNLATVQDEKAELESQTRDLSESLQKTKEDLNIVASEREVLNQNLDAESERKRQLQEELQKQQQILASKESALAEAKAEADELTKRQQQLETTVKIRETEKAMLEQNLVAAKAEVDRARIETERAQSQAEALASGVNTLAESSTALKQEIREAQPLSINAIYRQYEQNRALISFQTIEKRLFGSTNKSYSFHAVTVQAGGNSWILFERTLTPFAEGNPSNILQVNARLVLNGEVYSPTRIHQLREDGNILAIKIGDLDIVESSLSPYSLAKDPLRFPKAVLVDPISASYGELNVRLKPGNQNRLEINQSLLGQIFGDFQPSRGDLLFAQSGELLGFLTQSQEAIVLQSIDSTSTFSIGDNWSPSKVR